MEVFYKVETSMPWAARNMANSLAQIIQIVCSFNVLLGVVIDLDHAVVQEQ